MAPETLISIQLLEWVETNAITKIIKFPFQQLLLGLKSKLKRLKCLENCVGRVSSLPEIITFDSTIGFLLLLFLSYNRSPRRLSNMRLKLKSRKGKIADVSNQPGTARAGLQPLRVHRKLNNHFFIINTPWAPKKIKKKKRFLGNLEHFLGKFSLSLSLSLSKYTQKPLISHLFPTIKR